MNFIAAAVFSTDRKRVQKVFSLLWVNSKIELHETTRDFSVMSLMISNFSNLKMYFSLVLVQLAHCYRIEPSC